jgi:hypothetical protein
LYQSREMDTIQVLVVNVLSQVGNYRLELNS